MVKVTPDTTDTGIFTSVSCPSVTLCVAVGYDDVQAIYSVGTYSGGAWSFSTPTETLPDGSGYGRFFAVDCVSTTSCEAVGYDSNNEGVSSTGTYSAGAWSWTTSDVIANDGSANGALYGMSCATATACIAVGYDANYHPVYSVGTDSAGVWSWSAEVQVAADSSGQGQFAAVSCASATSCVAVGTSRQSQGLYSIGTESGNVWTWSASTDFPASPYPDNPYTSVSCPAVGQCIAAGDDDYGTETYSLGSETGNAWTWSVPANVELANNESNAIPSSLSCASVSSCVAVGSVIIDNGYGAYTIQPAFASSVTLPGVPTIASATAGYESATVNWSAGDDGGSALTGYSVSVLNVSTSLTTTDACPASTTSTATSCTVSGLVNGDNYTFTVAAINDFGTGPPSSASNAVTPSPVAPGTPTITSVTVSGTSATVQWAAGSSNGSPITGYLVRSDSTATQFNVMNACPSSQTSTATQCTVTGLINGSSYLFAVAAINGDGTGTYSASSNEVSVSAPPANNPQSPLTITTTAGPAFNGASTSSLALGTSGGNVGGLDAYGVGDMTSSVTILNTSSNAVSGNVVLSIRVSLTRLRRTPRAPTSTWRTLAATTSRW
jgi:hypothetical protein